MFNPFVQNANNVGADKFLGLGPQIGIGGTRARARTIFDGANHNAGPDYGPGSSGGNGFSQGYAGGEGSEGPSAMPYRMVTPQEVQMDLNTFQNKDPNTFTTSDAAGERRGAMSAIRPHERRPLDMSGGVRPGNFSGPNAVEQARMNMAPNPMAGRNPNDPRNAVLAAYPQRPAPGPPPQAGDTPFGNQGSSGGAGGGSSQADAQRQGFGKASYGG